MDDAVDRFLQGCRQRKIDVGTIAFHDDDHDQIVRRRFSVHLPRILSDRFSSRQTGAGEPGLGPAKGKGRAAKTLLQMAPYVLRRDECYGNAVEKVMVERNVEAPVWDYNGPGGETCLACCKFHTKKVCVDDCPRAYSHKDPNKQQSLNLCGFVSECQKARKREKTGKGPNDEAKNK